jgi:hypothetical protein
MTTNHTHDEPTMGPATPTIPDSFRAQALERRVMALTNEKFMLENQLTEAEATNMFNSDVISALKKQLDAGGGGIIGFLDDVDVDTLDKYLANDVDLSASLAVALIGKLKEIASAELGESS